MVQPGDVVTALFQGAQGVKRRPAVVVSSNVYHATRPDVVLCLLTTQTAKATDPTDYLLQDWQAAGLLKPSAFRSFPGIVPPGQVTVIGHVSARDWREVQIRLGIALETIPPALLQAEQAATQAKQERDAAFQQAERERSEKGVALLRAETAETQLAQEKAEKEKLLAKLRELGVGPTQGGELR